MVIWQTWQCIEISSQTKMNKQMRIKVGDAIPEGFVAGKIYFGERGNNFNTPVYVLLDNKTVLTEEPPPFSMNPHQAKTDREFIFVTLSNGKKYVSNSAFRLSEITLIPKGILSYKSNKIIPKRSTHVLLRPIRGKTIAELGIIKINRSNVLTQTQLNIEEYEWC